MPSFADPSNLEPRAEPEELAVPANATSLDFLRAVYRSPTQPLNRRMRAAEAALPFESPKLAVTAHVGGEQFGAALERALKRSGKMIEHTGPMIDHSPQPEAD